MSGKQHENAEKNHHLLIIRSHSRGTGTPGGVASFKASISLMFCLQQLTMSPCSLSQGGQEKSDHIHPNYNPKHNSFPGELYQTRMSLCKIPGGCCFPLKKKGFPLFSSPWIPVPNHFLIIIFSIFTLQFLRHQLISLPFVLPCKSHSSVVTRCQWWQPGSKAE